MTSVICVLKLFTTDSGENLELSQLLPYVFCSFDPQMRHLVRKTKHLCFSNCFFFHFPQMLCIFNISAAPGFVIFQMVSLEVFYTS